LSPGSACGEIECGEYVFALLGSSSIVAVLAVDHVAGDAEHGLHEASADEPRIGRAVQSKRRRGGKRFS